MAMSSDSYVPVGARDSDVRGGRIGAHEIEKVTQTSAAKSPDHVPTLDTDVARIVANQRECRDLIEPVRARPTDGPAHLQRPPLEIDAGIDRIEKVVRKSLEGHDIPVRKRRGEMRGAEERARHLIAEVHAG